MATEENQKKWSQLVTSAWADENLKKRLLNDPMPLLPEQGIEIPAGAEAHVTQDKNTALALMKNYDPFRSPKHFKMTDLLKKFDKTFSATGTNSGKIGPDRTIEDVMKRWQDRWNFLFIAGMWFQDLFNYDFRRTEQCIIPYATQEGEISFCAYNTGVGWRNIIEKMHMTSTLTKWYEEHGRHEIFAGGKKVNIEDKEHALYLREEIVTHEGQHDLDKLGIAKTAREEKMQARDKKAENNKVKNDAVYDARMAQLYREVVMAALLVLGVGQAFAATTTITLLQTRVPEQMRGRVMSLNTLLMMGIRPVGDFPAGALISVIGAPVTVL